MLRIRPGNNLTILGRPDDGNPAPVGLYVGKGGFTGWDDGAEVRGNAAPRPGKRGMFDLPSLLGGRAISITGWALAASEAELGWWRSVVTGLGADGEPVRFTVDHQGQTLWADARIEGTPRFLDTGIRHGMHRASFLMQFSVAKGLKYGETNSAGPAASVVTLNYGNFAASSLIEVTGSMPSGYTINGPLGRKYTVTQALTTGQKHLIDMANGRLFLNGVQQFKKTTARSVWAVPGGGSVPITITPVSGSGLIKALTPNTYN